MNEYEENLSTIKFVVPKVRGSTVLSDYSFSTEDPEACCKFTSTKKLCDSG
jgi:hypothetical protein